MKTMLSVQLSVAASPPIARTSPAELVIGACEAAGSEWVDQASYVK